MRYLTAIAALATTALAANSGQATFYGGNTQGGACSFSTYTIPSGIYGTAISSSNWANSAVCGACVSVTGPSGGSPITAMIVDECPGCGENHLDLFPDAFAKLANPSKGVIDVTWEYVNCPIASPLQVHMKEGVSANWLSVQVVNGNKATDDIQVSEDGGSTWISGLTRESYNYFQLSSGSGTSTVAVKAISDENDDVIVKNVAVTGGKLVTASSNY